MVTSCSSSANGILFSPFVRFHTKVIGCSIKTNSFTQGLQLYIELATHNTKVQIFAFCFLLGLGGPEEDISLGGLGVDLETDGGGRSWAVGGGEVKRAIDGEGVAAGVGVNEVECIDGGGVRLVVAGMVSVGGLAQRCSSSCSGTEIDGSVV